MILAFDLGGTHVSASAVELGAVTVASMTTRDLPVCASAKQLLSLIADAGEEALRGRTVKGIAMAAPGPFDYVNGISLMRHKHTALLGISMRQALAQAFAVMDESVLFLNDAQAFLLGEMAVDAIAQRTTRSSTRSSRVVGITLGTGIGSAFFADGRIITDAPGVPQAGELYRVPWATGIVEDVISTKAILSSFHSVNSEEISVKAIADQAAINAAARHVLEEFGQTLGKVLDTVLQGFQPELVILGGAITKSAKLFLPELQRALKNIQPEIRVSRLLERAALLGAAECWLAKFSG